MKDDFSIKGEVIEVLEAVIDPAVDKNLVDAHIVEEVEVSGGKVEIVLVMDKGRDREQRFQIEDAVADGVEAIAGVSEVKISTMSPEGLKNPTTSPAAATSTAAPAAKSAAAPSSSAIPPSAPITGVGRVIAIASGKGGVGKSTVAVNVALALKHQGFRVALLDVDIYGPSLPTLLGVSKRPLVEDGRIVPIDIDGLRLMSIGFLMEEDTPVIWRGPIVTGIIRQFLRDVDWSGTDYLVVDLPPGTGDAQLALAQTVPVDGAVIVSTPSELALVDAARGLQMFTTLNIDVIGLVENMSKFVSPSGEVSYIFGKATVAKEAKRLKVPYLGDIPIYTKIREGGDQGRPIVATDPEGEIGKLFLELATKITKAKPIGSTDGTSEKKGLFSFLKG